MIAVCKDVGYQTVVLGYAAPALPTSAGPDQQPHMNDKGGQLKTQDAAPDPAARLGLRGAWIDLN